MPGMGVRAGLEYPEGNSGGLMTAASRLSSLAALVAAEADGIARAGQVGGWEGRRYASFQAAVHGIVPGLESGAGALRRAARLVDDLAEQLQRAQRLIRAWAEEIEAAEKDVQAAQSALADERFKVQTFGDPLAPFPGLDPVQEAQARYDKAARLLAELRERYQPRARRLCEELEQEDRSVSAALLAAAAAAPAGGTGAPGAPDVPADVRLFAPVFMFTPSETYLPADPRRNISFQEIGSLSPAELDRYLRGQGAGAPIFYRERNFDNGEKVIEYWFYRRYNHFRDVAFDPSQHPDDSEGVAVRFKDGRPVQIGYTQHSEGCSLDYGDAPKKDGHPGSYPSDGSGSNSPTQGVADNEGGLFGIDMNPLGELHGPAPGERTPPENVVHGEDNLVDYDGKDAGRPWSLGDPNERRVPDNDDNSAKFQLESEKDGLAESPVWSNECEPLRPRE